MVRFSSAGLYYAGMDAGTAALIAGLLAVGGVACIPAGWRKAAGGLLIAATIILIATDALTMLFR